MFPVPSRRHSGSLSTEGMHSRDEFRREFESLFNRFFGGALTPLDEDRGQMRVWDFNINETDKEIVVRAEMPGFEEKDLDVQLQGNVLSIKAEKEQKGNGQEEYRSYSRAVTLPEGIDAEKVQATYRNGVLELHIPRPEGSQGRQIQIQGQPARRTEAQRGAAEEPATGADNPQAREQAARKRKK